MESVIIGILIGSVGTLILSVAVGNIIYKSKVREYVALEKKCKMLLIDATKIRQERNRDIGELANKFINR